MQTEDYPGLVVNDGRVTGSITAGNSRLPLWAISYCAIVDTWDNVEEGWEPSQYGMDAEQFAGFVTHLLDHRRSFARLLCVLADVYRRENPDDMDDFWERDPEAVERVRAALHDCISELPAL